MALNGAVSNNIHTILSISFGRPFHNMITCSQRGGEQAESFCQCVNTKTGNLDCVCGEDDTEFDWVWDKSMISVATLLSSDCREVIFHQDHSCGTAAVRADAPLSPTKQHYWEIKMMTPAYGTDMMIGVGTTAAKLDKHRYRFCSLLGSDEESWGLSFYGNLYHNRKSVKYAPKFGQGCIIGVHYDAWNGTLTFFKNRQSLGIAFNNLQGKVLYPMVSSTAARSGMKVIRSRSFDSSLQYLCLRTLKNILPQDVSVIDALKFPPGLETKLKREMDWLVGPSPAVKTKSKMAPFKRSFSDDFEVSTKRRRFKKPELKSETRNSL
uniref:B30.2/SPRY domain-containing protein n=1 Tax=Strigamia maritima TaxID=126957 RepID=T1IXN2_STRMM